LDRNKDKIVEKLVEESTENALRDIEKLDESA
jgi:phosphoribosyl-ATP pyrophosphohydrolase